MHAKIVNYQDSTGRGVIMNLSKTLFDFNKELWHDPRIIPSVGLLVECRLVNKQITDARASRYQSFEPSSLVGETDFWQTDTDDELENLEEKRRQSTIQSIYRSTNYTQLSEVQISIPVAQSIKKYFTLELATTDMLNSVSNTENSYILEYKVMKRFILKALDTLLYLDRLVIRDHFLQYTSLIARVENAYQTISRLNQVNTTLAFEENFLKYQLHYQALLAAIAFNQESLALCNKKIKQLQSELKYAQRAAATPSARPPKRSIQEIERAIQDYTKQPHDITKNLERLTKIKDDFYQSNLDTFKLVFESTFNRIAKKLKEGLDLCGTLLDDQVWKTATKSVALKAQYFKHDAEANVCAVSFATFYLGHLDKSLLSPQDDSLQRACKKIDQKLTRYYLIVSSDIELTTKIKMHILAQKKYNIVKYASKPISLQSLLKEIEFAQIFITENIDWLRSEQILEEIAESKMNQNTKVTFYSSREKCEDLVIEE